MTKDAVTLHLQLLFQGKDFSYLMFKKEVHYKFVQRIYKFVQQVFCLCINILYILGRQCI